MLELYHGATSVCSSKVRVGLVEKDLEWVSHPVNLAKGEQNAPGYLTLNPKGVVPTLIDGDLVIVESSVILEYVDALGEGPSLMPRDIRKATQARMWLAACIDIHAAINTMTFSTVNRSRILATKTPDEIEGSIRRMSNPATASKRRDVLENGLASTHVDSALFTLSNLFDAMQVALQKSVWLLGEDYSIADTAIISYIDRLDRLGQAQLWSSSQPEVARWFAASTARPSYDTAIGAYCNEADARKMRADGGNHWPEVEARWKAFQSRRPAR